MKRANPAKLHFIGQFPDKLIEHDSDKLKDNIKFSFQYFDNSQEAGQDFNQWTKEQLEKLLNKLKHYSVIRLAIGRIKELVAVDLKF